MIDTTVLIPHFAGNQQAVMLIRHLLPDGIAVSILSYLEAYQGAIEEADPEAAKRQFNAFFRGIPVLEVSPAVAKRCAEIRSFLKKQGKNPRKRAFDLVIAATALEHGLELVTHNMKDYQDIPSLVWYHI
ncbi:MAG: type II toxin-antitoxin system VapC family toxin [Thermomicrobiales bacterium]